MRLTDISIRKLKLLDVGQKMYRDDTLPGFGIRVSKKYKTFVVMYGSKRQLKTIGRYPDLSLADARKKARAILLVKPELTSSTTYQKATEIFLNDCKKHNRPETIRGYRGYLERLDYKGKLSELSRTRMKKHFVRYDDKPSGYNHALAVFRVFFNFCLRQELTEKNPIAGERAIKLQPKERVLNPDELRQLWEYEHHPFSSIVKLCLLTGQRRSEIAAIIPEWIEEDSITFPREITKNKRPHTIPASELVLSYLDELPFGREGAYNGWSNGKRRIDNWVKIDHWTLHDLRRTFATIHAELGTPIHITEKLLNHASGSLSGVVSIYNKYSYLDEMRTAQEQYEVFLADIIK